MASVTPDRILAGRLPGRRWPRLFAAAADEPRARRATDLIVAVAALLGLGLLAASAEPQAAIERAVISFVRSFPEAADGVWRILVDLLVLAALVVVAATVVRRRWAVLRDVVLALVVTLVGALLVGRVVRGNWPAGWDWLRDTGPGAWFPSVRVALPAAVVLAAGPQLTRPARRLLRWLLALGVGGAILLGAATPTAAIGGWLVASVGASLVHLVFGSCSGRPSLDEVAFALEGLGLPIGSIGVAARQTAGTFLVEALDANGAPLLVRVYGRDAYDTQLLTTAWRTLWFREAGSPSAVGRVRQVEHEAFLTLLARQAGALTQEVVAAATTASDDVLLVLRPMGQALDVAAERFTEHAARLTWEAVDTVHRAGISHGQVDDRHLVVDGDRLGLVDFRGATAAPGPERTRTDDAQALVATALALGAPRALAVARETASPDRLAALLPYLQLPALTPRQRVAVREAGLDLDELRNAAAGEAGVEAPELEQLRRVTWRGLVQIVLLVVAFLVLTRAVAGVDLAEMHAALGDAVWALVLAGLVLAQVPRLAQAVSVLGASPNPIPLEPLYLLQLAQSYIALTIPTAAARIGISVRFFQRHGLASGAALAVGALDGFAGFLVQVGLLVSILLFTPRSLELDVQSATAPWHVLLVAVAAGLVAIVLVAVVPRWRSLAIGWTRQLTGEALGATRGLASPRRLGLLFGGNLGSEVFFALALGAFVRSLGYPVSLVELIFINVSVSVLAGFLPIPGGIGVIEGGLTFGLVRAGVPEETALAAVLMYRVATFYLPPVWGFFALHWLERNQHL